MRILVTGGCGFIGSALVPRLASHEVTVIDTQWFGKNLPENDWLTVIKDDIRTCDWEKHLYGVDCVIHLAAIANDPCGDLDPKLTWEVNALATMQLADAAMRASVKHFIYASSGSVYGVKDEEFVIENMPCVPLSEYNKTKMVAERAVLSYSDGMAVQVLRPATVCGWSPRTRLDVAVNALTISALSTGEIKVFGGGQIRPNVHIADMVRAYLFMLSNPQIQGVYNVGFEDHSLSELAKMVQEVCGGTITTVPLVDIRSYRLTSFKLKKSCFKPAHTVMDAIRELKQRYESGALRDTNNGYNLRVMPR